MLILRSSMCASFMRAALVFASIGIAGGVPRLVLSAAWQCSWISAGGSKPSTARTSSYSSSRQE
jgi:hypothetical protein